MTLNPHNLPAQIRTEAELDSVLAWLTHSLRSQNVDHGMLGAAVAPLSKPADPVWIMARVASLLDPYFDKGTPQAIREIEAEDWADALAEFPKWAIQRACRWWKSDANGDRRKRPLEGDIAARCKFETQALRAARIHMQRQGDGQRAAEDDRPRISDADRAKRRAQIGDVLLKMQAKLGSGV